MAYYPCQVKLKTEEIIDRVYIAELDNYLMHWGIMPEDDEGKASIRIEEVIEIKESPNRMPIHLANKLYEAGESGMGYCVYKMELDDGQIIDVLSGNAVDFPPIPQGFKPSNIKDVFPHKGSRKKYIYSSDYYWCIYEDENSTGIYGLKETRLRIEERNSLTIWDKLKRIFSK